MRQLTVLPRTTGCCLALLLAVGEVGCEQDNPFDQTVIVPATAAADVIEATTYPDVAPGKVAVRRLTQAQLRSALTDVFGADVVIPALAEPDVRSGGLLAVGASEASLSARGVESLEALAYAVSEQVLGTAERQQALVPCTPAGNSDAGCARKALDKLGLKLWRRPLTETELERLAGLAATAGERLEDFHDGLEIAIAGLLQSPNFLFRVEVGEADPATPGTRKFTGYELASRLSFFLWNTTPDDALLEAAAKGELESDEGLRTQAERLLASPRARAALRNFFTEYLELYELDEMAKDTVLFEHFSPELAADAKEETLRGLEHVVFDSDSDYRDILTARETFLNPRLAALYDLPAPDPSGFRRVRLPDSSRRTGLLSQASFLMLHAHAVASSATLRGAAVRRILLCQDIPIPPVNVDTSIPEPSGQTLTLRDRVAEHLENPSCAGCHLLTDPVGLALENFDALARWRDRDNGALIDASGELDGATYVDHVGLAKAVRDHEDLPRCLATMLTRYATGRLETNDEADRLDALTARFAGHGYRVQPLLLEVVTSPLFRDAGELN